MTMTQKRKNTIIATRIIILIVTVFSFLFSIYSLLHVSIAGIHVQAERCAAAEIYSAEYYSPNGPSETWEEMKENIKNEFSDGSWAIKLVSGNIDKDVAIMMCLLIGVSFSASLIGGYWIVELMKK